MVAYAYLKNATHFTVVLTVNNDQQTTIEIDMVQKIRRPKHPLAMLQTALESGDKNAIVTAHSKLLGLCRADSPAIDWDDPDYAAARDYFLQTNK
jgi:hypothetical protein